MLDTPRKTNPKHLIDTSRASHQLMCTHASAYIQCMIVLENKMVSLTSASSLLPKVVPASGIMLFLIKYEVCPSKTHATMM